MKYIVVKRIGNIPLWTVFESEEEANSYYLTACNGIGEDTVYVSDEFGNIICGTDVNVRNNLNASRELEEVNPCRKCGE